MKQSIIFLSILINTVPVFSQLIRSDHQINELQIIDSTLSKENFNTNIIYFDWFRNSKTLYVDIVDSLDVIYQTENHKPFSGQILLLRDTAQLVIRLNYQNGRKFGWQRSYNDDGTIHEEIRYGERYPNMPVWLEEWYVTYKYHEDGQLKRSQVLHDDTLLLYNVTNFYPNRQIASEGRAKYVRQEFRHHYDFMLSMVPSKRAKRRMRRQRKKGEGYYTIAKTSLLKTDHWIYYNQDGSTASEGGYEIGYNKYGEICEQKVGEWRDYNKMRPLDISAFVCEFPLRIDQIDFENKSNVLHMDKEISSAIDYIVKDYASHFIDRYPYRTYKDTYLNTILLNDSLYTVYLVLLKHFPTQTVDGNVLFYDRREKTFIKKGYYLNLQTLYEYNKEKIEPSYFRQYQDAPEIEIADYDEDGINDYKLTRIVHRHGIYQTLTTNITIQDGKIKFLGSKMTPVVSYK